MNERGRHSVLIVEGDAVAARELQEMLITLGYDAFAVAASAEEAVARAAQRCPDLVLTEVRIHGQHDGIQAADLLRQRFGVPVVYVTAHADDATLERAKKTEPYGYLLKPVRPAELRSAIEICLFRLQMDRRLRERERLFSTTLRSIADAVVAVDLAGTITFMNSVAEELTGVRAEQALGRPAREIVRLVDEQRIVADESPLEAALHGHQVIEVREATLLNLSTGARQLISDSAAPVTDGEHLLGAVMVFRNVTEQKRLQKQLELTDRLASLGTMAAGVAHEIDNPLAVIVNNAVFIGEELARRRAEEPDADDAAWRALDPALSDLNSAAHRIDRIVADLRAFSRPQNPEQVGLVDPARCVEWALRSTARELRGRARVSTQLESLPSVRADETKLGQVFVNLLLNAAHAIAPGAPDRNEVRVASFVDALGEAVIEVRDSGCGIPPELLGKIFDPFFTTKEAGVGTGLGLPICRGIVTSLGGRIEVETRVGEGSLFRVRLPVPPRSNRPAPPAGQVAAASGTRGNLLVVDDESTMRRVVQRVLREHEVTGVESAREALELIAQGEHFDLILSDIAMPEVSGVEFYQVLLQRDPELAARVVFVSGGALSPKVAAFLAAVPNARIDKPFEAAALRALVRERLDARA